MLTWLRLLAAATVQFELYDLTSDALTAFSEVHYSTEDGWLDEEMKIIITGEQQHAGLMVGSCKTKRVEFFVLPGKINRFLTRC
jgi:hypothetical protein